jgi:hypothetical protein
VVQETLLLPRKWLSAPERHLHPQAMLKNPEHLKILACIICASAQVIKCLPIRHEALGSNSRIAKKVVYNIKTRNTENH